MSFFLKIMDFVNFVQDDRTSSPDEQISHQFCNLTILTWYYLHDALVYKLIFFFHFNLFQEIFIQDDSSKTKLQEVTTTDVPQTNIKSTNSGG